MASIVLYFLLPFSFLWGRISFALGFIMPTLVIFYDKTSTDYYSYYSIYVNACSLDFGSRSYEFGYPLFSFISCFFLGNSELSFDIFNSLLYLLLSVCFVKKSLTLQRILLPGGMNHFILSSLVLFVPIFLSIIQINWNFRGGFSAFLAYLSIIDYLLYRASDRRVYLLTGFSFALLSVFFHIQSLPLLGIFGLSQILHYASKKFKLISRFSFFRLKKHVLLWVGFLVGVIFSLVNSTTFAVALYKMSHYQLARTDSTSTRVSLIFWISIASFLILFSILKKRSIARFFSLKPLSGLPFFVVFSSFYIVAVNLLYIDNSFMAARFSKAFEPAILFWFIVFSSYSQRSFLPLITISLTAFYSYSFVLKSLL